MTCTLCGSEDIEVIRDKIRHGILRKVLQCKNCELNFLEHRDTDLKEFYSEEYRNKYTHAVGQGASPKEVFDACLPFQNEKIERIKHVLGKDRKLLDAGCSAGHFLHTVKDYVGSCEGLELNKQEATYVKDELGLVVHNDFIENLDIPKASFDVITSHHVLEHIEDPISFLTELKKLLAPGGHICIEVPNIQDILMTEYKIDEFTDFWFRDVHLFNFSPKTLNAMMEKVGFKGEVQSIVSYNMFNHINWLLNKEPQATGAIGMSDPVLVNPENSTSDAALELNKWALKIDKEYKEILDKHYLGDSILFIGQAA